MDRNREKTACIGPHNTLLRENQQLVRRRSSHNIPKQTGKNTYQLETHGSKTYNSQIELKIHQAHYHIEDAEKEDKEALYDQLQEAIHRLPAHDMLLVIGDLNARMGNDNTGRESNMGTHGCGIMNDNGQRLCELCEENKQVIRGTIFHHKEIYKKTWTSPGGTTTSQIDHVLVNEKWRSSLQNVRTRRGADVASDHNLVTGTVTLKLQKTKQGLERERQLDSKRMKNDKVKTAF